MTRKELVKLLEASYGENEEVFVKYDDDQGTVTASIGGEVSDFTETIATKTCWEIQDRETGTWREISDAEARSKGGCSCRTDKIRFRIVETQNRKRKCIVV